MVIFHSYVNLPEGISEYTANIFANYTKYVDGILLGGSMEIKKEPKILKWRYVNLPYFSDHILWIFPEV